MGIGLCGTAHATLLRGRGQWYICIVVLNRWHALVRPRIAVPLGEAHRLRLVQRGREGYSAEHFLGDLLRSLHLLLSIRCLKRVG